MRYSVALAGILVLGGCGKSYSDLEGAFGTSKIGGAAHLPENTLVLTSQRNPGAESYRGIASIYLSMKSVDIEVSTPFTKPVSIPTQEVAACGMTCFGYDNRHVNLLIPKVGVDVMIRESKQLLDWCWDNKKPMVSGEIQRNWAYKGAPLPLATAFSQQFESRAAYDYQTKQSCLGY